MATALRSSFFFLSFLAADAAEWELFRQNWRCFEGVPAPNPFELSTMNVPLSMCQTICEDYKYMLLWVEQPNTDPGNGNCHCSNTCLLEADGGVGTGNGNKNFVYIQVPPTEPPAAPTAPPPAPTAVPTAAPTAAPTEQPWVVFKENWACDGEVEVQVSDATLEECKQVCSNFLYMTFYDSSFTEQACRCTNGCDSGTPAPSNETNTVYVVVTQAPTPTPTCLQTCSLPESLPRLCQTQIVDFEHQGSENEDTGSMPFKPLSCDAKRTIVSKFGDCDKCKDCDVCETTAGIQRRFELLPRGGIAAVAQHSSRKALLGLVASAAAGAAAVSAVLFFVLRRRPSHARLQQQQQMEMPGLEAMLEQPSLEEE